MTGRSDQLASTLLLYLNYHIACINAEIEPCVEKYSDLCKRESWGDL